MSEQVSQILDTIRKSLSERQSALVYLHGVGFTLVELDSATKLGPWHAYDYHRAHGADPRSVHDIDWPGLSYALVYTHTSPQTVQRVERTEVLWASKD